MSGERSVPAQGREAESDDTGCVAGSSKNGRFILITIVLMLGILVGYLHHWSVEHVSWELTGDRRLVVRSGIFHSLLWSIEDKHCIDVAMVSPWRSDWLLVGISARHPDGGRLLCLTMARGDTVWSVEPDISSMIAAFDSQTVLAADFSCRFLYTGDLEGDGEKEVIVVFSHHLYYPSAVCVVGRDGRRTSQYANRGHIFDLLVEDIDKDGKDEILAFGVNNSYDSPTVILLDDRHRSGASVDSLARPSSQISDSALVRLVLPPIPSDCLFLFGETERRIAALHPVLAWDGDGMRRINFFATVPNMDVAIVVHLDEELHIISCEPSDGLLAAADARWPREERGPCPLVDAAWLVDWMTRAHRFVAGHWPPANAGRMTPVSISP